jgi:poly-beta-1,6-N-acetyl-D-glucosamine N-deacetylase
LVIPKQLLSTQNNIEDKGIIVLMYHRFEENKYPSTNIKVADFIKHLNLIKKEKFKFVNPNDFENSLLNKKKERKILLTIDDGFKSFYDQAWPILKKEKIPFILFVNTREVGTRGYMDWNQIKEISKEEFAHIGNHSYSHEYLVDMKNQEIIDDINVAASDFKNNLGYNSSFFSYPFGEYSNNFKTIIKDLGFKYAFGQHSGVIDETKDFYELPRFPINEAYGELKRFETILQTIPFKFKSITPEEKYIQNSNNPPEITVEFFENSKNIKLLNCYSNELNSWRKSEIEFLDKNKIKIKLIGKFTTERGRVNCSLRENDGSWRWLGMQFVVADIKN